jgi:hypothetical protein
MSGMIVFEPESKQKYENKYVDPSLSLRLYPTGALFSLPQSSKFFHSLSITSIFNRLHGVLNVGKKITNYTV